ncbi:MAG: hypothetical protein HYX69_01295 [Planctomycetia bacterium]|nr:hypothetical protein [Planctomycetia bacterium]
MYSFHITLHARPADVTAAGTISRRGRAYPTLQLSPEGLATAFPVSFEAAAAALARLPRMYIEPDGSFVWVSPATSDRCWQVDGVLYDRDGRLLFVDLKGTCPAEQFDRLLSACGWPGTAVMIQLTREAVFLDEATFRAIAAIS